jgi:hypothetical protein
LYIKRSVVGQSGETAYPIGRRLRRREYPAAPNSARIYAFFLEEFFFVSFFVTVLAAVFLS